MASLFNLSHLKERYSAMVSDKSVSIHATLAEMLGTGMVVLIGTAAVELSNDTQALSALAGTATRALLIAPVSYTHLTLPTKA